MKKPSATLILVVVLAAIALFFLFSQKAVNPLADLDPEEVESVAVLALTQAAVLSPEQQDELVRLLREVKVKGTDTGFYMGSSVACTLVMKNGENISVRVSGYYYNVNDNAFRIDADQGDSITALILGATPVQ